MWQVWVKGEEKTRARPQGQPGLPDAQTPSCPFESISSLACCGVPSIWWGWDPGSFRSQNTPTGLPQGPHLYDLILGLLQLVRLIGPQQPSLSLPLLLQCGLSILPALPCLHALVKGSLWGLGKSTTSPSGALLALSRGLSQQLG